MNIYNNDYLSLPQQVDKNKKDIAELKDAIPYPINWLGEWESDTIYEKYDGVSYNGSSYIFIADTPLESTTAPSEDSTHWQLFAERGEQGPQGPQGEQGPAGQDGANGQDGADGTNGKDALSYKGGYIPQATLPNTSFNLNESDFNRTPAVNEDFIGYLLVDGEIYWADLLVSAVSSGQVTVSRKGGTNFIKLNGPAGTPGATFSYDSGTGVLTITTTV